MTNVHEPSGIGTEEGAEAYFRDIVGLVPNHHNKVNIVIKRVVIFLLVVGLAFTL